MTGFLVRRLANYVVLCLIATFLAYTLASLTFHPLDVLLTRNPPPSAVTLAAKARDLHLDEPLVERYFSWLGGVLHGDFGQTIDGVRFIGDAYFILATFGSGASDPATFTDAGFTGDADFSRATFQGPARFSSTRFSGDAEFLSTAFKYEAAFRGATFTNEAHFNGAMQGDNPFRL